MVATTADFQQYVGSRVALVDKRLDELLQTEDKAFASLFEAARYSLFSGGKRLRPLLALTTAEAFGACVGDAVQPACALELIHTYSMIHDDLPCMDNDDFRRGKPTLHRVYPEGHAVLAGDFLLTYAFEVLAASPNVSDSQKTQMVVSLAQAAGGNGMVGGQALDLDAVGKAIGIESLELIHRCKTAALIAAALQLGGIVAGVDTATITQLTSLGFQLGLAFQVVDDILDVEASETKHGKAVSSDVSNTKTTYVTLLGLQGAKDKAQELLRDSSEILANLPGDTDMLKSLAQRLVNRSH